MAYGLWLRLISAIGYWLLVNNIAYAYAYAYWHFSISYLLLAAAAIGYWLCISISILYFVLCAKSQTPNPLCGLFYYCLCLSAPILLGLLCLLAAGGSGEIRQPKGRPGDPRSRERRVGLVVVRVLLTKGGPSCCLLLVGRRVGLVVCCRTGTTATAALSGLMT
jgi:hypothetical protein